MSIWFYSEDKFEKAAWYKKELNLDAYLICPGPSLAAVKKDLRGRGRKVFGINTSYPKITPDIWMGMDHIDCYNKNILYESFPKIFRGSHEKMKVDDKYITSFPEVYFASLSEQPGKDIFSWMEDNESLFVWQKNTLYICIQLMLRMGAKKIHFVGCDLGGKTDYFDERVLSESNRKHNKALYDYQLLMLEGINELCKKNDVTLISCTPGSRINQFMEYIELDKAINITEESHRVISSSPILHCLDQVHFENTKRKPEDRIAVITPTRGDRDIFLEKCKNYVASQTVQPDEFIVIDYEPSPVNMSPKLDQIKRVIEGVKIAKNAGCRKIIIMEDDDYYGSNYIENVLNNWENEFMIGGGSINSYHILLKKYLNWKSDQQLYKDGKKLPIGSTLSQTAFTVDFFENFLRSGMLARNSNLDVDLWTYARAFNFPVKLFDNDSFIAIKHNMSLCAGGMHSSLDVWEKANEDPELKYLEKTVGKFHVEFYKQLHESKNDSTLR